VEKGALLVILGKQGAGKGTQCVRLSHYYAIPHISSGDMLRSNVRQKTELGLKAKAAMDAGELIPDQIVTQMVQNRLMQDAAIETGFILDGYPRTVSQAKTLDEMLLPNKLDAVVNLDVPKNIVIKRLASRRVCVDCQTVYSTSLPPKINWTCDVCGGEVIQREDDTESAILRRLELYDKETFPLMEYYSKANLLKDINGVGSTEVILKRIIKEVDSVLKERQ
jgi:adenylate kinase